MSMVYTGYMIIYNESYLSSYIIIYTESYF